MTLPPLLAIAKGRRARPRKAVAPRASSEAAIQRAICDYLRAVAPDVVVYAIPNAARRSPGGRAGNAVPGLLPGMPDLGLILPCGRAAFIEVKTERGKLSAVQYDRMNDILGVRAGWHVATCIEDVRAALAVWKVKTRESRGMRGGRVLFGERAEAI